MADRIEKVAVSQINCSSKDMCYDFFSLPSSVYLKIDFLVSLRHVHSALPLGCRYFCNLFRWYAFLWTAKARIPSFSVCLSRDIRIVCPRVIWRPLLGVIRSFFTFISIMYYCTVYAIYLSSIYVSYSSSFCFSSFENSWSKYCYEMEQLNLLLLLVLFHQYHQQQDLEPPILP